MTPVLKWMAKDREEKIHDPFKKALAVRGKGADAKERADACFFETLVRVHRAAEGAPFTGLKPSGTDPGPAVAAADKALESGSADALVKLVTEKVAAEIRERLTRAAEAKKHAFESVEAGQRFVQAYVESTHHAEAPVKATPGHHHH